MYNDVDDDHLLDEDDWDAEAYFDEMYSDDEEDGEFEIEVRKYDTASLSIVTFNYHEDTPLYEVLDEVSTYVEDNALQDAIIHSMQTETDVDNEDFKDLTVTFYL